MIYWWFADCHKIDFKYTRFAMKITLLYSIYICIDSRRTVETNNVNKCHHAMTFVRFSSEHHASDVFNAKHIFLKL